MAARTLMYCTWLAAITAFTPVVVRANEIALAGPSPAEALQSLEEGNVRFQAGASEGPRRDDVRRLETYSKGQHPFAAILACADSRVPPEILFDTGIGDLFVVRVAGNVADTDEIGTLEYGVEHLHTPLIVVVGHTKCGAVTAVVDGAHVPPNIALLVDNIVPAVETTRKRFASLKGAALVQQAIRMNVRQGMSDILKRSEIVREAVQKGNLKVVGAVYDINSGSVEWMGPHPDETALLGKTTDGVASADGHAGELVRDDKSGVKADSHAKADPPAAPESHAQDAHAAEGISDHPSAKSSGPHSPAKPSSRIKPDAHDSHAKPAKGVHSQSHDATHPGAHDDPHSAEAVHPATQPHEENRKGAKASTPHNFLMLGGCLAGGAVMSMLTIHLSRLKKAAKPTDTSPTSTQTKASH